MLGKIKGSVLSQSAGKVPDRPTHYKVLLLKSILLPLVPVPKCRLLFSRLPLRKSVGDESKVNLNVTKLTELT